MLENFIEMYASIKAQEIEEWLREALKPYFGDAVEKPEKYKEEIQPRFENKEFEFILDIHDACYILKKDGNVISKFNLLPRVTSR